MGTRADFYIGRGTEAEWLGSIAWDGDTSSRGSSILTAQSEYEFRFEVKELSKDDDFTHPQLGWPWPWVDSCTTDYAYAWDSGVWVACFGYRWASASEIFAYHRALQAVPEPTPEGFDWDSIFNPFGADVQAEKTCVFPDMTSRMSVTRGSRSGVMIIGSTGPIPASQIDAEEMRARDHGGES